MTTEDTVRCHGCGTNYDPASVEWGRFHRRHVATAAASLPHEDLLEALAACQAERDEALVTSSFRSFAADIEASMEDVSATLSDIKWTLSDLRRRHEARVTA